MKHRKRAIHEPKTRLVGFREKTLDQLEGVEWGEPTFESGLVTTCHRLRKVPVGEFGIEDLRIMIGQQVGLEWLIPLALEALEREPLAEGDFYPGDLLATLLRLSPDFWIVHPTWRKQLVRIVAGVDPIPADIADEIAAFRAG